MFYQEYITKTNKNKYLKEIAEGVALEAKKAYYLEKPFTTKVEIKGSNGSFEVSPGQQIIYNPLNNAIIDSSEKVKIYEIVNLIENKTVIKIQAEFLEKDNKNSLSNNFIFINIDAIKGHKQSDGLFLFNTIDDATSKIRYLGVIPIELKLKGNDDDCILLNYYTTD